MAIFNSYLYVYQRVSDLFWQKTTTRRGADDGVVLTKWHFAKENNMEPYILSDVYCYCCCYNLISLLYLLFSLISTVVRNRPGLGDIRRYSDCMDYYNVQKSSAQNPPIPTMALAC